MRDFGIAHVVRVGARPMGGLLETARALAPADFDPATDGICIHGSGTVLYVCSTLQSLIGRREAALVGQPVEELFAPADRRDVHSVLDQARHSQEVHATVHLDRLKDRPLAVDVTGLHADDTSPPMDLLYVHVAASGGQATAPSNGSSPSSHGGPVQSGSRRPTVLICDDESRLGALTAGLLSEYGFQSVTVGTGEDALRQLASRDVWVDVLLLDVNLSQGSSAADVLRKMSEDSSSARVILTSGLAEEDVDPDLLAHPLVVGYVAKPYAVEQLVHSIRRALLPSPS